MKRTMNGLLALLLVSCLGLSGFAQGNEWERLIDEARGLRSIKRHDRAAVAAKKALEVAEQAFGPDHPNVATSLTSLASVHVSQGEYEQAEPLYKRFLAIGEKAGPFAVATNLNKLASVHVSQGQYEQAELLYKRSLAIREKAVGPDHPSVAMGLENLADLYRKTGREEAAIELEKRAAAIRATKQ